MEARDSLIQRSNFPHFSWVAVIPPSAPFETWFKIVWLEAPVWILSFMKFRFPDFSQLKHFFQIIFKYVAVKMWKVQLELVDSSCQLSKTILRDLCFRDASTLKVWLYSLNTVVPLSHRSHLFKRMDVGEAFPIWF